MAWLKRLKQVSSRLHSPTGAFGERLRSWQRRERELARVKSKDAARRSLSANGQSSLGTKWM